MPDIEKNKKEIGGEASEKKRGRRICAWCKEVLGESETEEDTHGTCEKCAAKHWVGFKKPKQ